MKKYMRSFYSIVLFILSGFMIVVGSVYAFVDDHRDSTGRGSINQHGHERNSSHDFLSNSPQLW